ncbi:MAG: hypothetical protein WCS80_05665 [Bacilli bacterium]
MDIKINDDGVEINGKKEMPFTERQAKEKKDRLMDRIISIASSASFALVLIIYIALSLSVTSLAPSGYSSWAVWWILLLLGGLPGETIRCIYRRKFTMFPIWSLALFIYLLLGMYFGLWHPQWVILLSIPVYYSIFGPIDKLIDDYKKGRI